MPLGLGKLSILVPEESPAFAGLESNGFQVRSRRYLERQMPVRGASSICSAASAAASSPAICGMR